MSPQIQTRSRDMFYIAIFIEYAYGIKNDSLKVWSQFYKTHS